MQRSRDRLVAVAVATLIGLMGIAMLVLLRNARDRGVDALHASQLQAVSATARSFNQRQTASLASTATLSQQAFTFAIGGQKDQAFHDYLIGLIPEPESGFFLVRAGGAITSGVLFEDPEAVGQQYQRPGFEKLSSSPKFLRGTGGILPVGRGITTSQPTSAYVLPVLDRSTGKLQGSFVYELPIVSDSDFNLEIRELSSSESERWLFIDTGGVVIASSDASEVASNIEDRRLLSLGEGTHSLSGNLVVIAEVPISGWKLVFRQPTSDFERGLAGPLQTAEAVVVAMTFIIGAVVATMLLRRLRAAREEQRRLRELADSQEEFISIVSHELRTPVAGVLGFLETSLDHWDDMTDEERRHTMTRATMNARRLQSLTRDVLEAETIERGAMSVTLADVNLHDEVVTALASMDEAAPDRVIDTDLPSSDALVRADPDRLQQILLNLLDNAHKHSPPGQPIEVKATVSDGEATIAIHDHGQGVDDQTGTRIFDKFVRGSGDAVEGTGLGLFICRKLVEAQGGRIWVEAAPGEGATFSFTLKTASVEPARAKSDNPSAPRRQPARAAKQRGGELR